MKTKSISVGSDPEFFCYREGRVIASQGIVEGEKIEPYQLEHGGMCHRDNVLGEIGHPPAYTEDEFVHNLHQAIADVQSMIVHKGVEMLWIPFFDMPEDQLQHYEAVVLGCEPDFDCWGLDNTDPPDPFKVGGMRSAGGHIHIGFDYNDQLENQRKCAMMADIYIGCGTVLYDNDDRRRQLYGRAGHFRPKSYGIEYRTPSNVWVGNEELTRWIFRAAKKSAEEYQRAEAFDLEFGTEVQRIINESDRAGAEALLLNFEGELPPCQKINTI